MFPSPLTQWTGEDRRRRCLRTVYPAILLLIERAHLAGWSREEILIAIADAADSQLCDITGTVTLIDNEAPVEDLRTTCVKVAFVPK